MVTGSDPSEAGAERVNMDLETGERDEVIERFGKRYAGRGNLSQNFLFKILVVAHHPTTLQKRSPTGGVNLQMQMGSRVRRSGWMNIELLRNELKICG